jgi:hypothetical protein
VTNRLSYGTALGERSGAGIGREKGCVGEEEKRKWRWRKKETEGKRRGNRRTMMF